MDLQLVLQMKLLLRETIFSYVLVVIGLYVITPIASNKHDMELNNSVVTVLSKRKEPSSNPTRLWHMRLGYINLNMIDRLVKDWILNNLVLKPMPVCESCIEGKMTKRPFPPKVNRSNDLLELVYTNVCGPINNRAHGGYEYLSHSLMTTLDMDMFI